MTEETYIIRNEEILKRCIRYIEQRSWPYFRSKNFPMQKVEVSDYEKKRTPPQNAMYWVGLEEPLNRIRKAIKAGAEKTGHSELELRIMAAERQEPIHQPFLFVRDKSAAHDIIKTIYDIPTSTKLGTKKFAEYTEKAHILLDEIAGDVEHFMYNI